jgi:3-deoxy-D-manno-octulosonic-acid transferase
MVARFFLLCWSLGIAFVFFILSMLAKIIPKLSPYLEGRTLDAAKLAELLRAAAPGQARLVVFCSSAGEYEQAVPLIETAHQEGGFFVLLVFFSPSGINFIKARGDRYPYILAPLDTQWQWERFFSMVKPEATVVVRHELWPAFLTSARRFSKKLLLVNVSQSSSKAPRLLIRWGKRCLFGFFDQIYF